MTLRRALYASPLAVLVAVFAHLAAFGFGHAPGGEGSGELFATLAAALALGVFAAFAAGMLGAGAACENGARAWYAPLALALAGTASFGCIEWSEGHFLLRTLLEAAVFSVPLAYAVAHFGRATRSALRAVGATCRVLVCRALARGSRAVFRIARDASAPLSRSLVARGALRGRAPPALI